MAQNSKIEWCDHTFNPVLGCTKVSPGCANCYAEAGSKRNPGVLGIWGPDGQRNVAGEASWANPPKWDRWARTGTCPECGGKGLVKDKVTRQQIPCERCDTNGNIGRYRGRIFCASLADIFEARDTMPTESWPWVERARQRLFYLIQGTPDLDWLLLTKRPEEIIPTYSRADRAQGFSTGTLSAAGWPPGNAWLGASVEDQERAEERIPFLIAAPAKVRFLSCEPLLGPLDLSHWLGPQLIHWVIVGGESGPHARRCEIEWCEEIVEQCRQAGVACFVKQLGAKPSACGQLLQIGGKKGQKLSDWPEHLQVREFPNGV